MSAEIKCKGCNKKYSEDELSLSGYCPKCSDIEEEDLEDMEDDDFFDGTEFDY